MPQVLDFTQIAVFAPADGRQKLGCSDFATDLAAATTDQLREGKVNLYWTQARFTTAFAKAISKIPVTPPSTPTTPFTLTADAPLNWDSVNHILAIPQATAAVDGYLSATDWTTFNSKVSSSRSISTTAPLAGGGDLSADRTLSIPKATAAVDGYLAAADFTTFAAKESALTFSSPLSRTVNTISIPASTNSVDGYLSAADHTTFLAKPSLGVLVAQSRGGFFQS